MELALIWFLSVVAVSEQNIKMNEVTNARIDEVELRVYEVEKRSLALAGAVSSQRALQQVNHQNQQDFIKNLYSQVEFLDMKITGLTE